jgi:hypothetical protein
VLLSRTKMRPAAGRFLLVEALARHVDDLVELDARALGLSSGTKMVDLRGSYRTRLPDGVLLHKLFRSAPGSFRKVDRAFPR